MYDEAIMDAFRAGCDQVEREYAYAKDTWMSSPGVIARMCRYIDDYNTVENQSDAYRSAMARGVIETATAYIRDEVERMR